MVRITYCTSWGYLPKAARAAAAVKNALAIEVELVKGSGGIFTVEVDGQLVAKKTHERGFPTEEEVVEAVRQATSAAM